jgi:hypothetical protein
MKEKEVDLDNYSHEKALPGGLTEPGLLLVDEEVLRKLGEGDIGGKPAVL